MNEILKKLPIWLIAVATVGLLCLLTYAVYQNKSVTFGPLVIGASSPKPESTYAPSIANAADFDSGWMNIGSKCATFSREIDFSSPPRLFTAYYKISEGDSEWIFPWGLNQYGDVHQTNGVLLDFDNKGNVYIRLPCGSPEGNNALHLGWYKNRQNSGNQRITNRDNVQFRFLLWK